TAENGEAGIETALREWPDLILCDLLLPGMDGYAVVRSIRAGSQARLSIPIVAVTALAMEGDREKGLSAGFNGYISKPIDPEEFVMQVDAFLRAEQRGSLPHAQAAQATAAPAVRAAHKATLLVVDDSPTNRELIYHTLSPIGYEVRLANSVRAGLEQLAIGLPDLILSDLHMPGEDGFNLVRLIKADPLLAKVPFVFISSSVWGEECRETALRLGVSRFLLRPIEPQALIDEIASCLAAHAGNRGADHAF
ncbi:MAG TPA: response regulator, partial [Burkholderiales bacterium]|nr:response regulator [Burkholderiales bacterium]